MINIGELIRPSNMRPTHIVHDLSGIDPERFVFENPWVRAVSYDRDGTVTDYHSPDIPEAHLAVLHGFAELGIRQGFNSNSGSAESVERIMQVAENISELIGDRFFVAASFEANGGKPGPKTFELFEQKSGVKREATVHVGDQILKDVCGAKQAGLRGAILVARYGQGDDWRVRYAQRPTYELAARAALGMPLRVQNYPRTIHVVG